MTRSRNKGAALFTAIFLIVVMSGIGVTVTVITATQQVSSGQALEATGAYYAARARLEREIDNTIDLGQGGGCPGGGNQTIDGYTTTFACTPVQGVQEGGITYDVIQLTVTAYRGSRSAGTRVRRQLRAQITRGL